jgi:hypothetical protein
MQKKFLKIFSSVFAIIFIGFFGAIFINNSNAVWTGPTASPPNSNTFAPLDISLTNQTKLGGLTIGKDLYLKSGLRLLSNGGSNYGYLINIADTLTYNTLTGGVEVKRFTIGNDGNVAIGNITPTAKLHVAGDIRASGKIYSGGDAVLTSGSMVVSPNSIGSLEVIDGSLMNVDINTASIQSRVNSSCTAGSSIRAIAQDGTVTCEPDDSGASYIAGSGISITGNTISAAVATETDPTVPANIKDGVAWSELSGIPAGFIDGVDNVGGAALGPDTVGSLEIKNGSILSADIDTTSVQSRVKNCPSGQAINSVAADGTVTCEPLGGVETDPTVPANIKDGVAWSELSGIPAGFLDGTDDTAVLTSAFTYLLRTHSGPGYSDLTVACGVNSLIAGFGCYTASGLGGCSSSCDTMLTGNTCSGRFSEEAFIYCMQF